jgi:hypothetical protein
LRTEFPQKQLVQDFNVMVDLFYQYYPDTSEQSFSNLVGAFLSAGDKLSKGLHKLLFHKEQFHHEF